MKKTILEILQVIFITIMALIGLCDDDVTSGEKVIIVILHSIFVNSIK